MEVAKHLRSSFGVWTQVYKISLYRQKWTHNLHKVLMCS